MTPNQKEAYDHMQKALEKLLPMARKHGTLFGSINPWTEACDIGDAALTVVKNVQNEQLRCGVLGALYTADQLKAYGQACREAALEDAAQICRLLADCEENTTDYRNGAAWCAEKIRSLK